MHLNKFGTLALLVTCAVGLAIVCYVTSDPSSIGVEFVGVCDRDDKVCSAAFCCLGRVLLLHLRNPKDGERLVCLDVEARTSRVIASGKARISYCIDGSDKHLACSFVNCVSQQCSAMEPCITVELFDTNRWRSASAFHLIAARGIRLCRAQAGILIWRDDFARYVPEKELEFIATRGSAFDIVASTALMGREVKQFVGESNAVQECFVMWPNIYAVCGCVSDCSEVWGVARVASLGYRDGNGSAVKLANKVWYSFRNGRSTMMISSCDLTTWANDGSGELKDVRVVDFSDVGDVDSIRHYDDCHVLVGVSNVGLRVSNAIDTLLPGLFAKAGRRITVREYVVALASGRCQEVGQGAAFQWLANDASGRRWAGRNLHNQSIAIRDR